MKQKGEPKDEEVWYTDGDISNDVSRAPAPDSPCR